MSDTTPNDAAAAVADAPEIIDPAVDAVMRLQLDRFEGPFEVLLYLIRSQEIDVFDIPILKITEQYLAFLDLMRAENLDVAGEFLVMAATLIQIKSRMILPVELETEEDEEIEEEDPRLELVEKLLEYRKFRDLAEALGRREGIAGDQIGRRVKIDFGPEEEDEEDLLEVEMYDLIKAIRSVLRFVGDAVVHQVEMEGASVDEKVALIEDLLARHNSVSWSDLRRASSRRIELVCCLLAILELCRMRRVRVHQFHTHAEIRLFGRDPESEGPISDAEQAILSEAEAHAEAEAAARAKRDAELRAAMEQKMAERAAEEEARREALREAAEREAEEAARLADEAREAERAKRKKRSPQALAAEAEAEAAEEAAARAAAGEDPADAEADDEDHGETEGVVTDEGDIDDEFDDDDEDEFDDDDDEDDEDDDDDEDDEDDDDDESDDDDEDDEDDDEDEDDENEVDGEDEDDDEAEQEDDEHEGDDEGDEVEQEDDEVDGGDK